MNHSYFKKIRRPLVQHRPGEIWLWVCFLCHSVYELRVSSLCPVYCKRSSSIFDTEGAALPKTYRLTIRTAYNSLHAEWIRRALTRVAS